MAKFSNIARPYALAAFEFARDHQQLATWKKFLTFAAYIVNQPEVNQLIRNPELPAKQFTELFYELLSFQLDIEQKNFLLILSSNKRFFVLPQIAHLFDMLYAAHERTKSVRIVTAVEIDKPLKEKLTDVLSKRINHDVTLHSEVDPAILGGAIIHIGDRVIDGSIRGKLTRLLEFSLR